MGRIRIKVEGGREKGKNLNIKVWPK